MSADKENSAKTILNLDEPGMKFKHEMEIFRAPCKECVERKIKERQQNVTYFFNKSSVPLPR
jgi:hypothetical protein